MLHWQFHSKHRLLQQQLARPHQVSNSPTLPKDVELADSQTTLSKAGKDLCDSSHVPLERSKPPRTMDQNISLPVPPSKALGPCTKDLLAVSLRTRKPTQPEDLSVVKWFRARQELLSAVQKFVALHGGASIVDRRRPRQLQELNNICEEDLVDKPTSD